MEQPKIHSSSAISTVIKEVNQILQELEYLKQPLKRYQLPLTDVYINAKQHG